MQNCDHAVQHTEERLSPDLQVGYKVVGEKKVKKPELGHLQKAGCPPMRHLREFKVRPQHHFPHLVQLPYQRGLWVCSVELSCWWGTACSQQQRWTHRTEYCDGETVGAWCTLSGATSSMLQQSRTACWGCAALRAWPHDTHTNRTVHVTSKPAPPAHCA